MKNPFARRERTAQKETAKSTEWDNLNVTQFAGDTERLDNKEQQKAERQQRKITAYLLYGKNGVYIETPDVNLNSGDEDRLSERLSNGSITRADERDLLLDIHSPITEQGGAKVYLNIRGNTHYSRILGYYQRGKDGFDHPQQNTPADFENFAKQFPTPIEFDEHIGTILEDIKSTQSLAKYKEYVRDIEAFKHEVYGKRQEYWEQINALEYKAEKWKAQRESEKSAEKGEGLVKSFGWYEMSRAQAKTGAIANNPGDRLPEVYIEDANLCIPEKGLFAVFDGAGGSKNINGGASRASHGAAQKVSELAKGYNFSQEGHLAWALNEASKAIEADPSAGLTTGTIAKVVEENSAKKLVYASVGDSRIYIVRHDSSVIQVTRDEGEGKFITNALGALDGKDSSNRTKQAGTVTLWKGDRVVLCTDGVTGDKPEEQMSNAEIGGIVRLAWDAGQAAAELVERARKTDDRTAVVFEV